MQRAVDRRQGDVHDRRVQPDDEQAHRADREDEQAPPAVRQGLPARGSRDSHGHHSTSYPPSDESARPPRSPHMQTPSTPKETNVNSLNSAAAQARIDDLL